MDADLLVTVLSIGFGAYLVVFNRNFSQTVIRQQKAVWKIDFSRYEPLLRVVSVVGGIVILGSGLWDGVRRLFP